jgi:hypothetical protein
MSTEYPEPGRGVLGFLGLMVVGGTLGFTGYMAARAGTLSAVLESVQTNLHLVATTGLVVLFGVGIALYYTSD